MAPGDHNRGLCPRVFLAPFFELVFVAGQSQTVWARGAESESFSRHLLVIVFVFVTFDNRGYLAEPNLCVARVR